MTLDDALSSSRGPFKQAFQKTREYIVYVSGYPGGSGNVVILFHDTGERFVENGHTEDVKLTAALKLWSYKYDPNAWISGDPGNF